MELKRIGKVVQRHLRFLLLVLILSGAAGMLAIRMVPKTYSSQTQMMVILGDSQQNVIPNLVTGQQLVETYATLASSPSVLQQALSTLPHSSQSPLAPWTERVQPIAQTDLFVIQVQSQSPGQAAQIANAIANALLHTVSGLTYPHALQIVDPAYPASRPTNPNPLTYFALSFLVGGIAAGIVIGIAEYLDDSIRDEAEVWETFHLPVLAGIWTTNKQGRTMKPTERMGGEFYGGRG